MEGSWAGWSEGRLAEKASLKRYGNGREGGPGRLNTSCKSIPGGQHSLCKGAEVGFEFQGCLNHSKSDWPLQGGMFYILISPQVKGMGRVPWKVVTFLQVKVFQVGPFFGLALVPGIQGLPGREAVQKGWVTGPPKAPRTHVTI